MWSHLNPLLRTLGCLPVNRHPFLARHGMHLVDADRVAGPDNRGEVAGLVQALRKDGQVRLPVCQDSVDSLPALFGHATPDPDPTPCSVRRALTHCRTLLQDCNNNSNGITRIRLFSSQTSGNPPASREASCVAQEAVT